MRYEDGRIDQFVSDKKTISVSERYELINEFRQRCRNYSTAAFEQAKNHITGEKTDPENLSEEHAAYAKRAEEIAMYGYEGNDGDLNDSGDDARRRPTLVPLIAVVVTMILVFAGGFFGGMVFALGAFLLGFSFLGFYAAYKGNGRGYTHYGGTSFGSSRKAGLNIGLIGLAGVIPLLFYGRFGSSGTLILMCACIFAMLALVMLIGFIQSFSLKSKYREEVTANCIGYSRIIDSGVHGPARTHHHRNRGFIIRTSPVFEYTYQGRDYKGIYDRMIDGLNADVDIGTATISIDPKHPEDIYHKSVSVQVKGLFVSAICAALAAMLIAVFISKGYASGERVPDVNMNGMTVFSLVFGSDKQRENILESFSEELLDNYGYKIPYEITDELVEQAASQRGHAGDVWYYEIAPIKRITEYGEGDYNIEFEDPTFPQLGKSGKHDDLGDSRMVFYTVYTYEYDGVSYYTRDIFLDLSPDEHTYVGSHGAYETGRGN